MKLLVNPATLAQAIREDEQRDKFLKKFNPEKYVYGLEVQTCDKWTTEQQGKLWRDFGIAAKLLETTDNAIYSMVKTNPMTKDLFQKQEYVGTKERGKYITSEKGLSQFTKDECKEAIEQILPFLEMVINNVYQQVVHVNWSCRENRDANLPDWEFTEEPYYGIETTEEKVIRIFDGEKVESRA